MKMMLKRAFNFKGENALMWASYATITSALVAIVLQPQANLSPWQLWAGVGLTLIILGLNVLFANIDSLARPSWGYTAYFVGVAVCFLGQLFVLGIRSIFYLLFMFAAQAFVVLPLRWAMLYTSVFLTTILVIVGWFFGYVDDVVGLGISLSLGVIFAATFAMVLVRSNEQTQRATNLLAQLQAANRELEQARERETELAVAQERVRLARDIHDGLGHHLTVLSVQLQAASKLLERDPHRAAEAIRTCRLEADAALTEVRQSVAAMRQSPLDGRSLLQALTHLTTTFAQRIGTTVELTVHGEHWHTSAAINDMLYRTAQEGLTNAHKHGGATTIKVDLIYQPDQVALQVRDNGTAQPTTTAGFGLAGLRERAEQLGGTCTTAATTNGFDLVIRLPQ